MSVNIIAAVARNLAIGHQNKLLYWLPDDMRRFRQLTTGHTIVMGRRTFESLPKGALPNRRNCVLTRTVGQLPGCECFDSWESFIGSCRTDEDIYIIGGASIYRQLLPHADRLFLTEVDDTPEAADAFFPDFRMADVTGRCRWEETQREHHPADDRHAFDFDFVDYQRITASNNDKESNCDTPSTPCFSR